MGREIVYQSGFLNHFESESDPGTLPIGMNNPQKAPKGLYAEQVSGTSFLMTRHANLRSWLYRILPSTRHGDFRRVEYTQWRSPPFAEVPSPAQMRWDPFPMPSVPTDFIQGVRTICANGGVQQQVGSGVHIYACNRDMGARYLCNADGDMLFVPQQGSLLLNTEFGRLEVKPGEIAVVQRGIKFQVQLPEKVARGYLLENFGAHFVLPDRGPIGANGLANERDFLSPTAWYEDVEKPCELIQKFCGHFWRAELPSSPLDVVAWHGNYAPFKYDLARFNTMNTVSFDHPDPSIFTVMSSPSPVAGISNVDFVIFPPRWMVAENTFRPPYYHRNIMSEYMGLIHGVYDAKPGGGFSPGGGSLHNCMTAHGPDAAAFEAASSVELKPTYLGDTLAFMFESALVYVPTAEAIKAREFQSDYGRCWQGLTRHFPKS